MFVEGRPVRVISRDRIENIAGFHRSDERSEYAVVWLRVPEEMFLVEFTEQVRWSFVTNSGLSSGPDASLT